MVCYECLQKIDERTGAELPEKDITDSADYTLVATPQIPSGDFVFRTIRYIYNIVLCVRKMLTAHSAVHYEPTDGQTDVRKRLPDVGTASKIGKDIM